MTTARDFSSYLERLTLSLDGPNSINARRAAQAFAQELSKKSCLDVSAVTLAARSLPPIGSGVVAPTMRVSRVPDDRDEAFDQAMEEFKTAARSAIAERADFEAAVAANKGIGRQECRELVHRFLGTQNERVNGNAIVANTRLSFGQVRDALEQLEDDALLSDDTIKSEALNQLVLWSVRLNSTGRNLLDGTKTARPAPTAAPNAIIVGSTFHNSPVAMTGAGDVNVSLHLPPIPVDVREAIVADSTASQQLRTLEEEVGKSAPRPKIVAQLIGGLRMIIESMDIGAEVAAHGHEWLTTVENLRW